MSNKCHHWRLYTLVLLLAALLLAGGSTAGTAVAQTADTLVVSPDGAGAYTTLASALADAGTGDTIEVHGGSYAGPVEIDKSVRLVGYDWPIIDGSNDGTVVKITGAGAEMRGFEIRNSGDSLDQENSGIAVEASTVVVEGNVLAGTLFGIYLREAPGSTIRDNVINSKDLAVPRRGDAIRVWYSDDVTIENNLVDRGRDVVLWYSERLTVRDNVVTNGRYGLHFMYCDDALVAHNELRGNSVGAFLMYSRRLHLQENTIASNRGPSGYGVGLKDMDDAFIEHNLFVDNRIGAFVDNSPREIDSTVRFEENVFAYNDFGVSLMPSVRRNTFAGNSFMDNQEQVNIAGGGQLHENTWTSDGRGNYWSDYAGFDANNDGRGDIPYKSERLFENLMDQHEGLQLFIYSPAAQAIDFAARAFPFVKPQPKLTDEQPLMSPIIPQGAPVPATSSSRPLALASLALIALAGLVLIVPRRGGDTPAVDTAHPDALSPVGQTSMPHTENEYVPMITVENVSKHFGKIHALEGISFEVGAGEAVALWGANGAGKTTALRCLLGLLPFDGRVDVAGCNVQLNGKEARRYVGFVPQELNFHDDMTVRETMRFYARLKKVSPAPSDELLERLELAAHIDKRVAELSGGMKQKLALAVALLADPPILMLDEPTANLDARARDDFLRLLDTLRTEGKTLIFSSHRLDEVVSLADRILVLENGQLVADCPPAEISAELGLHARLKLYLPSNFIEPAVAALNTQGYNTSRNGRGVYVRVAEQEKAEPIQVLLREGIPVENFEVERPNSNDEL